jgi:nucleoid-associated protein YgaU
MRAWIKSACVVLACILGPVLLTAGLNGPAHPAQANTRTAISTTEVTLTRALSAAASPAAAVSSPTARYVVQPGDTLSAIAARFAVPGGWPALYAANRSVIGPDPDTIRPGTVLALPAETAPVRYAVTAGDTLSGIAAGLAIPGGWAALYAANRNLIGPDPDTIRPGLVLTLPRPAAPATRSPGATPHHARPRQRPRRLAPDTSRGRPPARRQPPPACRDG